MAETTDEIIKKILSALENPPNFIASLDPSQGDWIDAVEYRVTAEREHEKRTGGVPRSGLSSPFERSQTGKKEWSVTDHVSQRLGHLIVNPSNLRETAAIKRAYVFQEDGGASDRYVNFSREAAKNFIERLIKTAQGQRALRRQESFLSTGQFLESDNTFILYGERGAGKTFFLNYALSEFDDLLDRENVIWIRLNLVDDFADLGANPKFGIEDLKSWIFAQTAKIILRYYDPKSKEKRAEKRVLFANSPSDFLRDTVTRLRERDKDYKNFLLMAVDNMCEAFHQKKHDEVLDQRLVPDYLGRMLFNHLQEVGYSIVLVFDGLDRLEATTAAKARFRRLLYAVSSLTGADDPFGAAYLVVMRTSTLANDANAYSASIPIRYEILPVDFERILAARLNLIKDEVTAAVMHFENWNFEKEYQFWPDHIDKFEKFLKEPDSDGHAPLKQIHDLFSSNRREQMHAIQFAYFDFLGKHSSRLYRLIESVMKCGWRYPPRHYLYIKTRREKFERTGGHRLRIDTRFLPSIFAYPYVEASSAPDEVPNIQNLMLGLRILQFVRTHDRLAERSRGEVRLLTVDQVAQLSRLLFDYDPNIVSLLIEEYIEFELLEIRHRYTDSADGTLRLLPKARIILDNLLNRIAYLNLASMRIPLKQLSFVDDPGPPLVRAVCLDGEATLQGWVEWKIKNSISVYRILHKVNETQRLQFSSRLERLNTQRRPQAKYREVATAAEKEGLFDFLLPCRDGIIQDVKAMLEKDIGVGNTDFEVDNILTAIDRHVKAWP